MKIFSEKSEITYKTVDTSYLSEIAALDAECFGKEAWMPKSIENDMLSASSVWIAAFCGGKVVGYINGVSVCDEAELNRIGVCKSHRRCGIGGQLVDKLVSALSEKMCKTIFLEVRESNDAARRLYEKMKYKQIGIRKRFYERPVEDAIVMSKMYTEGNIC